MSESASTQFELKQCSQCGTRFGCGARAAQCWCAALPPLTSSAVQADADCRCPNCLREALATTSPATPKREPRDAI